MKTAFMELPPGNELWKRILEFEIDDPGALVPFSKRLSEEQKWTKEFTERAIMEYKRFVYLCCISPTGASPSMVIDEVWHLHLLYTKNYWDDFCDKVLRQKLHHEPSSGGKTEKTRHNNWYQHTLEIYVTHFGEIPPTDIWNVSSPKKRTSFKWFPLLLIVSAFCLISCAAAPPLFYILIGVFVVGFVFSGNGGTEDPNKKGGNDSTSGSNCSSSSCSSSSSSCGSSCGSSGCGGCGGGGGD